MPAYMISYDLRRVRNYEPLINQLRAWNCVSPLESLWFGNLRGISGDIADLLRVHMDADDAVLVMEIKPTSDWAFKNLTMPFADWLRLNVGP